MRRLHDDNDFGDASLCLRRQQSIDCERSTLSARPSRTEGHHLDGRRQQGLRSGAGTLLEHLF